MQLTKKNIELENVKNQDTP